VAQIVQRHGLQVLQRDVVSQIETLDIAQGKRGGYQQRHHQDREVDAIAGLEVVDDANGYTRFYNPQGVYIARYPATPSNPYRRMRDLLVALKKAGLPWPPPSKKQQRAQRKKGGRT
jgi:hypothetical protein